MAIEKVKRYQSNDPAVLKFLDSLELIIMELADIPLLDGVLHRDVKITSGTEKTIHHKLGRNYRGFIVTKKNANANIWESSSSVTGIIKLNASATVTIDIWVF